MSEANTATYDLHDHRPPTAGMALKPVFQTPKRSVHRAYPVNADSAGPFPAESAWLVREDKPFYIPDILSDDRYDPHPEQHAAADEHARHLRKAQGYLDDAFNLVGVLLASLGDEVAGFGSTYPECETRMGNHPFPNPGQFRTLSLQLDGHIVPDGARRSLPTTTSGYR